MKRSSTPARTAALVFIASIVVANCAGSGGCPSNGGAGCAQAGCDSGSGCGGGCGGGGCELEPIPKGFPRAEEIPGGMQLRLTRTGLDFFENNIDPLIKAAVPTGLNFDVPPTCDQNAVIGNIHICANKQGGQCLPSSPACKISAAITSVKITPDTAAGDRMKVTARLSALTPSGAPLRTSGLINCSISLNTANAGKPDAAFDLDVRFKVDPTTKRTSISIENAKMSDLDGGDMKISGGFLCGLIDLPFIKGFVVNTLTGQIGGMVQGLVGDQLCATCDQAPCPGGATCDSRKICMMGKTCLQGLGLEARAPLTAIPGAEGKVDFIGWLGGLVQMPASGATLGLIAASTPVSPASCVKPRPELKPDPKAPIPISKLLQGNKDPDGADYDIGVGFHKRVLDQGAWSAYTAGGLCIEVGSELSNLLSTGTFSLIMPSLNALTGGAAAAMRLKIVPSAPPTIDIGKGVVEDDGKGNYTIKEPLLTIKLKDLGIQMFAMIEQRYVRLLTLTADVEVPLALHVVNGEIVPVIGALDNALSNLRVSGADLLAETTEDLQTKFPIVLKLAFGLLPDLLNQTIPLPALLGLEIQKPKIVGIENNTMLGLFARLGRQPQKTSAEVRLPQVPAETEARVVTIAMPKDRDVMRLRRRADLSRGPVLHIEVGGDADSRDLEYSWRLDGTGWSPFMRGPRLAIKSSLLFLLGEHRLELRARVAGMPNTTDPTPRRLSVRIENPFPQAPRSAADGTSGCAVAGTDDAGAGAGWLAFGLLALVGLRRRRRSWRSIVAPLVLPLALIAFGCSDSAPGASDGGTDGQPADGGGDGPPPKVLAPGILGKHSALAASGDSLFASAYEQTFGDLVLVSAKLSDPSTLSFEVIDGVPDAPPTGDPSGYRKGIANVGDDVGFGSDIAVDSAGSPLVSHHDVTNKALRFVQRSAEGWSAHTVATPAGSKEIVGRYTALALVSGKPAIAFLVQNIAAAAGTWKSELRWAVANSATPKAASDWTISTIDSGPSPCLNLCEKTEACFVTTSGSACKTKATTCATCAAGTACLAGKCEPALDDTTFDDVPKAMGLWPAALVASDGSAVVVYHDSVNGTLKAARQAAGAATWTKSIVRSTAGESVGAYPAALADSTGVHVAYQNWTRGTLHYVRIDAATLAVKGTSVIDDGLRADGRHPVGADASLAADGSALRVVYQDQQNSDLLSASRTSAGAWTPKTASDANLGRLLKGGKKGYGFYADIVAAGGKLYGSSYVFEAGGSPPGTIELFEIP